MTLLAEIEALLFVAGDEGLSLAILSELTFTNIQDLQKELKKLTQYYEENEDRGLTLIETANTYQLVTKREYAKSIKKYAQSPYSQTLSRALLETLAIIAYKQPITRMEIEEIRGVQVTGNLRKLRARQLIKELGHLDQIGNPLLYGTTDFFLDYFGINHLDELPALPEEDDQSEMTDLFFENYEDRLKDTEHEEKNI